MLFNLKKDVLKVKNKLLKWILLKISENQTFQRTPNSLFWPISTKWA